MDSPSRLSKAGGKEIDTKLSPTPNLRQETLNAGSISANAVSGCLLTPKSLKIPTPKTSSSDSKLTVDYFQGSEVSVCLSKHYSLIRTI